jgi:hypothetical protein
MAAAVVTVASETPFAAIVIWTDEPEDWLRLVVIVLMAIVAIIPVLAISLSILIITWRDTLPARTQDLDPAAQQLVIRGTLDIQDAKPGLGEIHLPTFPIAK